MTTAGLRIEVPTAQGEGAAHLRVPDGARAVGLLALGHGAGGGIDAPDLVAVADAAVARDWAVALVEQPYRVAGRRVGPRPPALDAAWLTVVAHLRTELPGVPLVVGGRSAGARVACRTAADAGADAVVCLAFPTRPPGRPDAPSREDELDAVTVPVLVVQGNRDPYGAPSEAPGRTIVVVPGTHALRGDIGGVTDAVMAWLTAIHRPSTGRSR